MNCKVCGNTSAKNSSLSFFRFPKENSRCQIWAERCNLLSLFEKHGTHRFYKSFRICSEHFHAKDIVFDGRKKRLLQCAVPEPFLKSNQKAQMDVDGPKDFTHEEVFKLKLVENLCRLCAEENRNLTDIFGWRGKTLNLEYKLKYFPFVVNKFDVLPLRVCHLCISKVNQFFDFITNCIKAETKLRIMLDLEDSDTTYKLIKPDDGSSAECQMEMNKNSSENKTPILTPEGDNQSQINYLPETIQNNSNTFDQESDQNFRAQSNNSCDTFFKNIDIFNSNPQAVELQANNDEEFNCELNQQIFPCGVYQIDSKIVKIDFKSQNTDVEVKQKCRFCNKHFKNHELCLAHEKSHAGEPPYVCMECGKNFRSRASFRQHKSVHSDKRLFSCQECGMSFKRKDTLSNHLRIHTGERPFVCKICGFAFKQRGDCMKHEKNHENVSDFITKAENKQIGNEGCNIQETSPAESKFDAKSSQTREEITWNEEKDIPLPSCLTVAEEMASVGSLEDIVSGRLISFDL